MAACYRWGNTAMTLTEPNPTGAILPPDAELTTMRLALIHLTGMWIEPAPYMNADMDAAARSFQAANGLSVDGSSVPTKTAVRAALARPETRPSRSTRSRSARTFGFTGRIGCGRCQLRRWQRQWQPVARRAVLAVALGRGQLVLPRMRASDHPSERRDVLVERRDTAAICRALDRRHHRPVTSFSVLYARTAAP